MGSVTDVTVRRATPRDAVALADLRWRAASQDGGAAGIDHNAFVESFTGWVSSHMSTHLPFLAEVGGDPVGMAWLMIAERVPSPSQERRRCGDVQSVYVVPELRDTGIGTALITAVLAEADTLALEHVTVHSSDRAVPLYLRTGFRYDQCWLRWVPE